MVHAGIAQWWRHPSAVGESSNCGEATNDADWQRFAQRPLGGVARNQSVKYSIPAEILFRRRRHRQRHLAATAANGTEYKARLRQCRDREERQWPVFYSSTAVVSVQPLSTNTVASHRQSAACTQAICGW